MKYSLAILILGCLLGLARADIIYLRDGTFIPDCQVKDETATQVSVKTPSGDMVVPRTAIARIQKSRTVQDTYRERLAKIRDGDAEGLYNLALWCRSTAGLRKEADELLARVISLKKDHAPSRRLLGHLPVGGEWVVPPPLSIRLAASGASAADLRTALGIFLQSREDVRLVSDSVRKESSRPIDVCTLEASVAITRQAGPTFYGRTIGGPTIGASVHLRAKAPWLGTAGPKTAVEGQVPGNGTNAGLGVQNAVGGCSQALHRFLDEVLALRAKSLAEDLRNTNGGKKATPGVASARK
jgi:hypothetical protein